MTSRPSTRLLAVLAAVVALLTLLGSAPAQAAASPVLVTVTNETGAAGPVRLYVLGTDLASGRLGYADASGTFTPWPSVAPGDPSPAPDVSVPGPASGASARVAIPRGMSGRIYYTIGSGLELRLVRTDTGATGLVQPAPWVSGDASASRLVDWSEFTYTDSGSLWINATQVDQFAIPAAVTVTDAAGTRTTGTLVTGGRQHVIDSLAGDPATAGSVVRAPDGTVLRVVAPSHASRAGTVSPDLLNADIDRAWSAYTTRPLTIVPFAGQSVTFTGRTVGTTMVFTDRSGAVVHTVAKPSSVDVLECAGALLAPNDLTAGPIARTLCAALNRGTLGTSDVEPVTDPAAYYVAGGNPYARVIHASMADSRAYAFAFDDVASQESLVQADNPSAVTIRLQPFGSSGASPTSAPTATTTAPASPQPTAATSAAPTPTATTSPVTSPTPSPTATTPATTPTPSGSGSPASLPVTLTATAPGWAWLVLGPGTGPQLITVAVAGGSTSRAAVDGPGRVRIDLSGPVGTDEVTVTGTGSLGTVAVVLP